MSNQWSHKVYKMAYNVQGEWFKFRTAATFADFPSADEYARSFAKAQGNGGERDARILVEARKGSTYRVVAEYRSSAYLPDPFRSL